MNIRRITAASAIGLATVVGIPLAAAPAAWAHDAYADITVCGSNYLQRCGYGGVTNSHTRVYSCDTYGDNYGFRTIYELRNGTTGYIDDANGSSSGCSSTTPGSSSNPVAYFRVVWKRGSTSTWLYGSWYNA